jgi:hypothetical protein
MIEPSEENLPKDEDGTWNLLPDTTLLTVEDDNNIKHKRKEKNGRPILQVWFLVVLCPVVKYFTELKCVVFWDA